MVYRIKRDALYLYQGMTLKEFLSANGLDPRNTRVDACEVIRKGIFSPTYQIDYLKDDSDDFYDMLKEQVYNKYSHTEEMSEDEYKDLCAIDCRQFGSWYITDVYIFLEEHYSEDDSISVSVVQYWHEYEKYLKNPYYHSNKSPFVISGREEDINMQIYDDLNKFKNRHNGRR